MSQESLNDGTLLLVFVLTKQLQSDLFCVNEGSFESLKRILWFFQYRATTLPAFKYYVTCAYLIFFCIFIVQILVLPKYVGLVFHSWVRGTMHASIFNTFAIACSCRVIQYTMNLRSPKGTMWPLIFSRTSVLGISFGVAFLILSMILLICFVGHFLVSKSILFKVWVSHLKYFLSHSTRTTCGGAVSIWRVFAQFKLASSEDQRKLLTGKATIWLEPENLKTEKIFFSWLRVRGWWVRVTGCERHYVNACPHKDRCTNVCLWKVVLNY